MAASAEGFLVAARLPYLPSMLMDVRPRELLHAIEVVAAGKRRDRAALTALAYESGLVRPGGA